MENMNWARNVFGEVSQKSLKVLKSKCDYFEAYSTPHWVAD
jgi:hypothetical protein